MSRAVEVFEDADGGAYVYDFDEIESAAQSRAVAVFLHYDRAMKSQTPQGLEDFLNNPATEHKERAFACMLRRREDDGTLAPWNRLHADYTGNKPGETLRFCMSMKGRDAMARRERCFSDFFDAVGMPHLLLSVQFPGGYGELIKLAEHQGTLAQLQTGSAPTLSATSGA